MRVEHQKDQNNKLTSEEQQLQRRIQLEQQGNANQIQALKQNLESTQQSNIEYVNKIHQLEETLRSQSRESQMKIEELEEINISLKRMSQDMSSRLFLLEEQSNNLQHSLTCESSSHKAFREEHCVKEENWNSERKQFMQKIKDYVDKIEELKTWNVQKEQALKESENARREHQEAISSSLQELQAKIDILQQFNMKLKEENQQLTEEVTDIVLSVS